MGVLDHGPATGVALAGRWVAPPASVDDIVYRHGRACWVAPLGRSGCNVHGCWRNGGGCNVHGCWNGPRGTCNVHGCADVGECSVHGCPPGKPRPRRVCVAEEEVVDVLGFDPDAAGGCNVHGCWAAGGGCNVHGCWAAGGGCNVHGCWNSPYGSCTIHGCSE